MKRSLITLLLTLSLSACGLSSDLKSTADDPNAGAGAVSQPANSDAFQPSDIEPDIHINVPPPETESQEGSEAQDSAYETIVEELGAKGEIYEEFSDGLREEIAGNVNDEDEGTEGIPGTSGGRFFTIFGLVAPTNLPPGDCNVSSDFLCIDFPQPLDGASDIFTIDPGVDVVARFNLDELAYFGGSDGSDPVAVISVFNMDTGSAASEVLIMPQDVHAFTPPAPPGETTDGEIPGEEGSEDPVSEGGATETESGPAEAFFSSSISLGGSGQFAIVVSMYQNINNGERNDLVSRMVTVYRTDRNAAEIEFVEAKRVENDAVVPDKVINDELVVNDVKDGDVISAEALELTVRLLSTFSPGVQVRFENYTEEGHLQGIDTVGYTAANQSQEGLFTGRVRLHRGINEIHMIADNPELKQALGPDAFEPQTIIFTVTNFHGRPEIQTTITDSNGEEAEVLVPQLSASGDTVGLEFCFTLVPGVSTADDGECVGGGLGFDVEVFLNGRKVDAGEYNTNNGKFNYQLVPEFGVNIYEVKVTKKDEITGKVSDTYAFQGVYVYGETNTLIENGEVNEEHPRNLFTKRGLGAHLHSSIFNQELKDALQVLLDKEDTKNSFLGIFKKNAKSVPYTCDEFIDPLTGNPAKGGGETSIEILEDSFVLGPVENGRAKEGGRAIELKTLEPKDDGILHVGLTIHGMRGSANMKPIEGTGNTFHGLPLGFLPIEFAIKKIDVNIGVKFERQIDADGDGVDESLGLDLVKIPGKKLFDIVGDGPMGKLMYVDSTRNALAAGIELHDWQTNLISNQFHGILGGTLLCGVEFGQNKVAADGDSINLREAAIDILNVIGKRNDNWFRIGIADLDLFDTGSPISMDVAAHVLRGNIEFSAQGVHVSDVPVRVTPGKNDLNRLADEHPSGKFGSVSRHQPEGEAKPELSGFGTDKKIALTVSEDTVNQGIFGAILSGLLDLDVDANF